LGGSDHGVRPDNQQTTALALDQRRDLHPIGLSEKGRQQMNKGNLILAVVVLSSLLAVLGGNFVDGH